MASALTQLLKGKLVKRDRSKMFVPVPFKWEHHQQKAFDELKHSLLKDVCLVHPDYSEPFVLEIDASRGALGAVLSQKTNKGELRPVAFASRKTNKADSNYPAHRLEFLALRWAVTVKFKDYLQYSQFRVLTDSNPLAYILKKLEVDAVSQRWAAELSRFDFDIEYRSGKSNTTADSLSRLAEPNKDEEDVKFWCRSKCPGKVKTVLQVQGVSNTAVDNAKLSWRKIQASDENIQYVINNIVNNKKINYKKVARENNIIKTL